MNYLFLSLFGVYALQAVLLNRAKSEAPENQAVKAALGPTMPFLLMVFYLLFDAGIPAALRPYLPALPPNPSPWVSVAVGAALLALTAGLGLGVQQAGPAGERARGRLGNTLTLLQTLVLSLACYLAYDRGVFTRALVSPFYIGLGLVTGVVVFGLSLLVTSGSWGAFVEHFVELRAAGAFIAENPVAVFGAIDVGLAEEMIYRAAAQTLLIEVTGYAWVGIVGVAIAFSVVHWHFFRNTLPQSAEFLGFAVLLGLLYHATGSLILVVVVHVLRNLEIVFLEFLIQRDTLGDTEGVEHDAPAGEARPMSEQS